MTGIKAGIFTIAVVGIPALSTVNPDTAFKALATGSAQIILALSLVFVVTALCKKDKKLSDQYERHLEEQKVLLEGNQKAMDKLAEAVHAQVQATGRLETTIRDCQMVHRSER